MSDATSPQPQCLRDAELRAWINALTAAGLECCAEAQKLDDGSRPAGDPAVMTALRCAHRLNDMRAPFVFEEERRGIR